MKHALISCAMLAAGLALAGCNPPSGAAPNAQALAAFNTLCVDAPGAPSVVTTLGALQMNAGQAKAYATAKQLCSLGAPTTAAGATLDAVVVLLALQQNFPNVKIKV